VNLSTALRLGRVSSLPTIVTNVLAAVALAGNHPKPLTIAIACIAMSILFVAGSLLNDAFDRDFDRIDRKDRPIPSGAVTAGFVFDAGFVLLGLGILLIVLLALVTGAGGKPILSVVALGALIIFFDADHRDNPLAPLLMGLCRGAVYTTAALLVRHDLCPEVLVGTALVVAYFTGLAYVSRGTLSTLWPLGLLALPFVVAWPNGITGFAIYAGYLVWVLRALFVLRGRPMKAASLVAGISLLDALLVANLGHPSLALVALGAFALTTLLQRIDPET
jgi:hypothetical protein